MTVKEFVLARDVLGLDNLGFGRELGLTVTQYQCRQVENIINGKTPVTKTMALAVECLLWRAGKKV